MRQIVCNTCGAIGYSAASAAYLRGGCTHCGAQGTFANLEDQKTVVLTDDNNSAFTYAVPQFRQLIEAVFHAAALMGDRNLHGLAGLLQHKLEIFLAASDEEAISLVGLEMLRSRVRAIHWALNRLAAADLPEEDQALDNGLLHLYYLRCDLYRVLHIPQDRAA